MVFQPETMTSTACLIVIRPRRVEEEEEVEELEDMKESPGN